MEMWQRMVWLCREGDGLDRRLPRDSRRPKSVQNAMLQYERLRTFGRHLCHFHFDILSSVQIVAFLPRKYFT